MKPLAYRMRPTSLDQVVGQQHLVGPGKILNRMVKAKMLSSMILYGQEREKQALPAPLPEQQSMLSGNSMP